MEVFDGQAAGKTIQSRAFFDQPGALAGWVAHSGLAA